MHMWSQYLIPHNLSEALQFIDAYQDRARIIAGGTDLVLDISNKKHAPVEALVDISSIDDLKQISLNDGRIQIGSAVTLSQILHSKLLNAHVSLLCDAVRQIAGPQIRNIATIGGNVVNASPAADAVPALLVLDSMVEIIGSDHRQREIPLCDFLIGNRQVALAAGEIVTGFHFKVPDTTARGYFRKVQPRRSMAIALLNVAVLLNVENFHISNAKISMGAVAPTAVRLQSVEEKLRDLPVDQAADPRLYAVEQDILPISDFRASQAYRMQVAQNLLHESFLGLLGIQTEANSG